MIPEDRKAKNTGNNDPFQRKIQDDEDGMKLWGILLFGLIGASATTLCVGQLRRTFGWFYDQLNGSQSWKRATGGSSFREEAWKRYNRRMQEEYEEEMERVERIRRMQSVFNRERNKYKRSYESWRENGPGSYDYQHFQRDDWYWKTDTSHKDQRTNSRATPRDSGNYSLSHHYSILGLDRLRATRYSDAEIKVSRQIEDPSRVLKIESIKFLAKAVIDVNANLSKYICTSLRGSVKKQQTAFRTKAKEYHPDQNQNNKEAAEAKFKEVMTSYEAIKLERKNGTS